MDPPTRNDNLTAEQCRPLNLDLDLGRQMLTIDWADGVRSEFHAAFLRKHCPCAACRTEREKRSRELLPVLKAAPASEIRILSGSNVGNYALQLDFSDNHGSGIYDFKLLRSLHEQIPPG